MRSEDSVPHSLRHHSLKRISCVNKTAHLDKSRYRRINSSALALLQTRIIKLDKVLAATPLSCLRGCDQHGTLG